MTQDDRLAYTPKEVADLLGIHRKTVYRMIQTGRLPATRINKRALRVTKEALMNYINDSACAHTPCKLPPTKRIEIARADGQPYSLVCDYHYAVLYEGRIADDKITTHPRPTNKEEVSA